MIGRVLGQLHAESHTSGFLNQCWKGVRWWQARQRA